MMKLKLILLLSITSVLQAQYLSVCSSNVIGRDRQVLLPPAMANDSMNAGKESNEEAHINSDSLYSYKWKLLADHILPQWRDGIATIVRGNDMYLIAGWNPRSFPEPFTATTNEIWRSRDGGVNWSLFSKAGFTPRHTFICINSEDGYVYVIGGDQYNNEAQRSEIWRSKDLMDWQLVSDSSPFGGRMLMAGVEYKGRFYVGGGQSLPGFSTGLSDLYVSADKGVTWTLLSKSVNHLGKNIVGTMCVFNNKIYQVSGGWYGGDTLSNFTYSQDVYSTADGINWSVEEPIPMPGVQYTNTIVFDNKLWCVAGNSVVSGLASHGYNKSEVCYMDQNGQWHKMVNSATDPKTHASSLAVTNNSMLMIAGNQLNSVYQLKK